MIMLKLIEAKIGDRNIINIEGTQKSSWAVLGSEKGEELDDSTIHSTVLNVAPKD